MPAKVTPIKRDWRRLLVMRSTKDGDKIASEPGNAFLMLSNGDWVGRLAYDSFTDRYYWAKDGLQLEGFDVPKAGDTFSERNVIYLQHWLSKLGEPQTCSFKGAAILEAAHAAAARNTRNSLVDWLRSLEWDGEQRLAKWCTACLGCTDSEYVSQVGRWWMISAVARAMDPGCKADHMLLLEGKQGAAKSTVLDILGGDWFLAQLPDLKNMKDAYQVMRGKWIGEIPEMDAMRKAEVTTVKAFLTVRVDTYRKAYGSSVEHVPRTIVFAGTTNDEHSLNDPTGARRFWPVTCGTIDLNKLREWRSQLWAEAVALYDVGEKWHPVDEEIKAKIQAEQEQRYAGDAWEPRIINWADEQVKPFGIHDILGAVFMMPPKDWNKAHETRVGAILARAGYRAYRALVSSDTSTRARVRMYEPKFLDGSAAPPGREPEFVND